MTVTAACELCGGLIRSWAKHECRSNPFNVGDTVTNGCVDYIVEKVYGDKVDIRYAKGTDKERLYTGYDHTVFRLCHPQPSAAKPSERAREEIPFFGPTPAQSLVAQQKAMMMRAYQDQIIKQTAHAIARDPGPPMKLDYFSGLGVQLALIEVHRKHFAILHALRPGMTPGDLRAALGEPPL